MKIKTKVWSWQAILILGATLTLPAAPELSQVAFPEGNFIAKFTVADVPAKEGQASLPDPGTFLLKGGEVRKVGQSFLYRLEWTPQAQSQIWREGRISVGSTPNGDVLVGDLELFLLPELATMSPASIQWIQPSCAKGMAAYKDKNCAYYEREMVLELGDKYVVHMLYKAWIDPETRRPVALNDGSRTYEFFYSDQKPPSSLAMPPALKKAYDRYMKAVSPPSHL